MSKTKLFIVTFLITVAVLSAAFYFIRPAPRTDIPRLTRISDEVFITSQLRPQGVLALRNKGIKTVVDVRPDGEASDQPSSADIEQTSRAFELSFHYIPVPHESIPDSAVQALSSTLKNAEKPVVLYCRTGRRAVRLLALAEAARIDGPGMDSILQMVSSGGFSAEDLRDTISRHIANRTSIKEVKN